MILFFIRLKSDALKEDFNHRKTDPFLLRIILTFNGWGTSSYP
jgi:hypothetical protein